MIIVIKTASRKPQDIATAQCVYVGTKASEANKAAKTGGPGVYHFWSHCPATKVKSHQQLQANERLLQRISAAREKPAAEVEPVEPVKVPAKKAAAKKAAAKKAAAGKPDLGGMVQAVKDKLPTTEKQ